MNANKVKQFLLDNNINVKKQFGQNFLLDENIINRICDLSEIDNETCVIEVGPGLGFLTKELSSRAYKVLCYEVDGDMIKVLTNTFDENSNVIIKYQDFLKANLNKDIETLLDASKKIVVVANLPYYITTAILLKILEETSYVKSLTVMMQQEVADRICGKPSTKDYNSLSVLVQYYTTSKIVLNVGPFSFYPEPSVDSSVVKIDYKKDFEYSVYDEIYFKKFNRIIFAQRRKTLSNNLKAGFGYSKELIDSVLNKNNISLSIRAEALSVKQIVELCNAFYVEIKGK